MAASFPLAQSALADLLRIRSVTWTLERFVETSGMEDDDLEADLRSPRWRGDGESVPMAYAEANQIMAKFLLLDGGQQTFYLYNHQALYPQSDPTGSILGAAAVKIQSVGADNKSLALKALTAGYVITVGDFLAVDYSSPTRRALFMFCASGTANGSGVTGELEVRPHVRPGIAANNDAYLIKPAAKVKLLPDSLRLVPLSTIHATIQFSARQTLRAG